MKECACNYRSLLLSDNETLISVLQDMRDEGDVWFSIVQDFEEQIGDISSMSSKQVRKSVNAIAL